MEEFDRVVTDPAPAPRRPRGVPRRRRARRSYRGAYRVFATSGATGIPGLFVYSTRSSRTGSPSDSHAFARVGVTPETRLIAIGAPATCTSRASSSPRSRPGAQGVPRLSVTTPLAEMVEALNAYQPEALIAYASVLGALAEEQLEGPLAIEPRVTRRPRRC